MLQRVAEESVMSRVKVLGMVAVLKDGEVFLTK